MSLDPARPAAASPVARFFGGMLIAVGAMLVLLCGGCGVVFLVGFAMDMFKTGNSGGDASFILLPIFLGGIPAGIGLGMIIGGRSLWRGPRT